MAFYVRHLTATNRSSDATSTSSTLAAHEFCFFSFLLCCFHVLSFQHSACWLCSRVCVEFRLPVLSFYRVLVLFAFVFCCCCWFCFFWGLSRCLGALGLGPLAQSQPLPLPQFQLLDSIHIALRALLGLFVEACSDSLLLLLLLFSFTVRPCKLYLHTHTHTYRQYLKIQLKRIMYISIFLGYDEVFITLF